MTLRINATKKGSNMKKVMLSLAIITYLLHINLLNADAVPQLAQGLKMIEQQQKLPVNLDTCSEGQLHTAVTEKNSTKIKELLNKGCPVDMPLDMGAGTTPLYEAVTEYSSNKGQEYLSIIQLLLDKGADINKSGAYGETALKKALENGLEEVITLFLNNEKFDPKVPLNNYSKVTPLHLAAKHPNLVSLFIKKGANVNVLDRDNKTPLHYAATNGNEKSIELLIKKGAKIDAKDSNQKTPLHYAAEWGNSKSVELLINNNANPKNLDENNNSPLHYAAKSGSNESVALLIKHGSQPNAQNKNKQTPLHYAAKSDRDNVLQLLTDKGANIDFADKDGNTPLHLAASLTQNDSSKKREKTIRRLLQAGANFNIKNNENKTPFDVATSPIKKQLLLIADTSIQPIDILERFSQIKSKSKKPELDQRMIVEILHRIKPLTSELEFIHAQNIETMDKNKLPTELSTKLYNSFMSNKRFDSGASFTAPFSHYYSIKEELEKEKPDYIDILQKIETEYTSATLFIPILLSETGITKENLDFIVGKKAETENEKKLKKMYTSAKEKKNHDFVAQVLEYYKTSVILKKGFIPEITGIIASYQ